MKKILFIIYFVCFSSLAMADTTPDKEMSDLILNIRRIGLELSKTSIKNPAEYSNSPISALNASDQDVVKGIFDTALEYKYNKLIWHNTLFMEYGKTTLKPYDSEKTIDENADKISLGSDLSYECWEYSGFKFGPTLRAAYDTEFTANGMIPRQNIARSNFGLSVFDHSIVKAMYLTAVHEYDFTYSDLTVNKLGAEFGWRIEYEIRTGVKLSSNGYYREYLDYSRYVGTDLERDLSGALRLDTNLWGNFTMGPYVQYRLAKSRESESYGSNFIIGVSFNYITKFDMN